MSAPKIFELIKKVAKLENRSAMTACISNDYTVSTQTSPFINLDTVEMSLGSDLELSNNTIICKRSGTVEISASLGVNNPAAGGNLQIRTYKNGNDLVTNLLTRVSYTNEQSFSMPSKIISVDTNTPINLYVGNWTSNDIIINSDKSRTFLSVKYID